MTRLSHQPSNNRSSCEPVSSEPVSIDGRLFGELTAETDLRTVTPLSLAYIGDAVFELYVRSRLLTPAKRARDYHQLVVAQVKAEQQAQYVDVLLPHLTESEQDLIRRGRNATTGRQRRANGKDYQKATGFEALLGFLYLSDQSRLRQLLNFLEI